MYSDCVGSPPVPITATPCLLDLVPTRICAGFPGPAEDLGVECIDLSKVLITHPQATFLQRVSGHSKKDAGIFDNDKLVIDRAIKPRHKMIVVAVVDSEFTVKQLYQRAGRVKLQICNLTYSDKNQATSKPWLGSPLL